MKHLFLFLALLGSTALAYLFVSNVIWVSVATSVAAAVLFYYVEHAGEHLANVDLIWMASFRYRYSYIRVSIAYLIKIKIDTDYLLIRGHRLPNQFQPVGGVYKFFETARGHLSQLGVLDDNIIPIDDTNRNDLRIRVKGQHLLTLLKWFHSGQDREFGPWREFHEELVATKILPQREFPHAGFRHIGAQRTSIYYAEYAQGPELIVAEIFELVPSDTQKDELRGLRAKAHKDVMFSSSDQILREGVTPGEVITKTIAPTAKWLLSN